MPGFVDCGLSIKDFDSCCELNSEETVSGTNQSVGFVFKE